MYSLNQLRRVGVIHIWGGVGVLLAGIIILGLVSSAGFAGALVSNLASLALFGVGWFMFNQLIMATTFSNLRKGVNLNNQPITRLKQIPYPPRRLGMDYVVFEITAMALAEFTVALVTFLVPTSGVFALGGFAGGWLMGSGFGKLRFVRKASAEEQSQERYFFFSDTTVGPKSEIAFYEEKPGKRTLEEAADPERAVKTTSESSLPPGVRRRAGVEPKAAGPTRRRAKIEPLVSTPPAQNQPEDARNEPK